MKRAVKIILLTLVLCAAGAGVYMNMNKTLTVSAIVLKPQPAVLSFTEKGAVDYEDRVSVYSPVSGQILETDTVLGQAIKAGDPICKIDNSGAANAISKDEAQIASLQAQIASLKAQIASLKAQITSQKAQIDDQKAQIVNLEAQIGGFDAQKKNLDAVTAKERDSLTAQKNNLSKELDTLDAQQNSANVSKDEQLRLQNIILTQNQADIDRLTADYNNVKILFDSGVVPEKDLQTSQDALDAAKAQYEQNQQQLQIIQSGGAQSNDAYFAASRDALQVQINGIESSLSKDYSGAMKEYYDAQIHGVNAQITGVNAQIAGVNAQITGVNSQIDSLNAQIDSVNVDIQAQQKLQTDSTVVSTVGGIVVDLPASTANMASAASPVAVIAVGRSLIVAYVSTNDINSVSVGKDVDLILNRREGDETYKGKIVKVDNKAEVRVSSLGVEERKIKVYIQPVERPELFLNGYDTDVKFLVAREDNALVLPKTAVFKDGNVSRVWKIADGVLQKADVTKGMELSNDVVIKSGLAAGDVVVSDASISELQVGAKAAAESEN